MSVAEKSINEEYYPISEEILTSFSKLKPSINLYVFREDISSLYPIAQKDQRLSQERVVQVVKACREGRLFISRSDKHIYINHLAKQAEFILIDPNLKTEESRDILLKALSMRLEAFFDQPIQNFYDLLQVDLMVFTEYIWTNKARINLFMNSLHIGDDSLHLHTLNVIIVGSWLYLVTCKKVERETFDNLVQGFALHDIGYTKIPDFILKKTAILSKDECEKIYMHPGQSLLIAQKLNVDTDESNQVIMQHHEMLDGKGYPKRLNPKTMSDFGSLAAVADTFSSMITDRPRAKRKPTLYSAKYIAKDPRYNKKYSHIIAKAYMNGMFKDR